jgi:hypothetical protein
MRKILIALPVMLLLHPAAFAQIPLTWNHLQAVKFVSQYSIVADTYLWHPKFSKDIKEMEGKEVYIAGYVIPLDLDQGVYVLSANPFASCFFCGGAGPESVVGLNLKKTGKRFRTDDYFTFKGKLRLNAQNPNEFNFILDQAEVDETKK